MAEARENATRSSRDMAAAKFPELSLQLERSPRDLNGFAVPVATEKQRELEKGKSFYGFSASDEYEEEEIELNLGLSLGGRFGVDKYSGKLKRSSSIVGTTPILRLTDELSAAAAAAADPYKEVGLKRTTSLPVEMEEEWRKRKEIQTLRRMEAKRRRSEKQKDGSGNQKSYETNVNFGEDVSRGNTALFGLDRWVSAAEKSGFLQKLPFQRQGSADSDGGGGSSSGMSELENKTPHDKSLPRNNSVDKRVDKRGKETAVAVEDMPCVFTKGLGPNGIRVEGILYKYGKGEEVRIMCVCHGNFLSPAEFVKHAGGGDVEYPLRHIVVNTSSSASSFL